MNPLKLLGLNQLYRQKLSTVVMVLNADGLAPVSRAEAVISAMRDSFLTSHTSHDNPDAPGADCIDNWTFGTTNLLRAGLPTIPVERSAGQARSCHAAGTSPALQEARAVSSCLWLSLDELAIPEHLITSASTRLHTSPVYELVANHIAVLTRHADELSAGPAAAGLGTVNVELVRALLTSAASDNSHCRSAFDATLLTRIRSYVREHLTDADLTPDLIATAHHISVRQLYKLCANADFSLHQWLTNQRLQGARDELAGHANRGRSIAMVAHRWGFTNPTHFSRRFRATYGMTPREWRRSAAQDLLVTSPVHSHNGR